jgi:radical SAM superfamily enzyme YgiQ (UPF0313 family)
MKILLINPNQHREPLGPVAPIGLDYLQGVLDQENHQVKLVDLCFKDDSELFSLIGDFTPDATGITIRNTHDGIVSAHQNFLPRIEKIIQTLKKEGFENIIIGGGGITSMPKLVFEFLSADYGVVGDGELPLIGLLKEIEKRVKSFKTPGIIYREKDRTVMNPRVFYDLNQLPENPRTLVDNVGYFKAIGTSNIQTKRTCPMQCAFCLDPLVGGPSASHRVFAAERVANEFQRLYKQGILYVYVNDPEFNLPPEHALAVSKELAKRKNQVGWSCFIHPIAATISEELVKSMKEAGCQEVVIGVDTVSPKVRKALNMYHTPEEVEYVTKLFSKHNMFVFQTYITGLPCEGVEELNETLDFVEQKINPIEGVQVLFVPSLRIFPGTMLEKYCREEGSIRSDQNCLEPTFYKPEHLEKELLPVLYERAQDYVGKWAVPTADTLFCMGSILADFVSENGLYGPPNYLFSELFKKT